MKEILMNLPYFGPISQFAELVKPVELWFENDDNYQKQTYRNRMYIYDSNGKLALTIPVRHSHNPGFKQHQKYREIQVENDFSWQKQHWRSLKTAYQTSPFFEFYEDELAPLYHEKQHFLIDFNFQCLDFILNALQLDITYFKTTEYIRNPENKMDKRNLINAKTQVEIPEYTQVFQEKHGFLTNLCVLDLLFSEGPNALNYLQNL